MISVWALTDHQRNRRPVCDYCFSTSIRKKNVLTEHVLKLQSIICICPRCDSISRYIIHLSWKTELVRQSPKKHCPRNICESTIPTVSPLQKTPGLLPSTWMFSFPQVLTLLNKFFTFWPSVNICKLFYKREQGLGPNRPGSSSKTLHLTTIFCDAKIICNRLSDLIIDIYFSQLQKLENQNQSLCRSIIWPNPISRIANSHLVVSSHENGRSCFPLCY